MDTNIIYNIDCVAGMNQIIDEESIDLIIADPPYFKVIGEKWDYLWRTEEDYLEWSEKWIAEAARVLRMGGSFYLFGYFRILEFNIPYDKISQTYHAQIGLTDVWDDVNFYEEKDRIHPTQKPQKLLARLILASSDEDDIVLDPFMGGGSTALACINNKRNYIGFEIEQEYYEKSLERLACRQMALL